MGKKRRKNRKRAGKRTTDDAVALIEQAHELTEGYYETRVGLYVDGAISCYQRVISGRSTRGMVAEVLPLLADAHLLRYEAYREVSDLDHAIENGEGARRRSRTVNRKWLNDTLGIAYALRYECSGNSADLARLRNRISQGCGIDALLAEYPGQGLWIYLEALLTIQEARLTEPGIGQRELRQREYETACAYRLHFEAVGRHAELLRAGDYAARAITAPSDGNLLARALLELATVHCIKYEVSGQAIFLNEAIGRVEEALAAGGTPAVRGKAYGELGTILRYKYAVSGDDEIETYRRYCLRQAAELCNEADRSAVNLQLALDELIDGSPDAVQRAKSLTAEVLQQDDRHSRLHPTATALHAAAYLLGEGSVGRDKAIDLLSDLDTQAVHMTEQIPIVMMNLASQLRKRSRDTGSQVDAERAEKAQEAAISSGWVPDSHAIDALIESANDLEVQGRTQEAIEAASEAVDLYCAAAKPFLNLEDEQARLGQSETLMTDAASTLIGAGSPHAALRALCRVTGHLRYFDRRLHHIQNELHCKGREESRILEEIEQYRLAAATASEHPVAGSDSLHTAFDCLAETLATLERVGTVDCRLPEAQCGTDELRIHIFTSRRRSHAILETIDHTWSIDLSFGEAEVAEQLVNFGLLPPSLTRLDNDEPYWPDCPGTQQLAVLEWIWTAIIEPIVAGTAHTEVLLISRWSWFPLGDISKLPLHAAMNPKDGTVLGDYVTQSRISLPTVSQGPLILESPAEITVLACDRVPGMAELASPAIEREQLHSRRGANLRVEVDEGSREVVSRSLTRPGLVHISSHGVVCFDNPQQSGLALKDFVSVSDILDLASSPSADLVVLSACSTAVDASLRPYEPLAVSDALVAPGVRCVVGALWSIADADAPDLMNSFYESLLDGASTSQFDVPMALRKAVRDIRGKHPDEPARWAGLVCSFGPG